MSKAILHDSLPFLPWMDPRTARLPGILPVEGEDWLRVDEAYAGQMAARDRLITTRPEVVHALLPEARPAADELYALVTGRLAQAPGYIFGAHEARRPDGVTVELQPEQPMLTLGRLVQEDLCLMEQAGEEHRLTAAVLCFPASWSLRQKIGRPLVSIHVPVDPYTPDVARRVQRLFDAIRPGQALWRMNWLTYDDPELHQPRVEGENRPRPVGHDYVRCERQCLVRLPLTRAVLFSIHTYLIRADSLPADARLALMELQH